MKSVMATVAAVVLAGLAVGSPARGQECVGDCGGDGMVTISDLILGVNIALGAQPVTACPAFDCQNDGTVPINCLIQGVNNALAGTCGSPPVVRTFTVDPGVLSAPGESVCNDNTTMCIQNSDCSDQMCPATATGLFTSALSNINAAQAFSAGPFKLVLGSAGGDGVRPLTLQEDAVFSIDIVDSSCLCLKFKAEGSTGSVDCDGGTPYDTSITQPSGPGTAWTVQTGLGDPAGPGNGNLIVTGLFQRVIDVCSAVDCSDDSIYMDPPNQFPFTTTNAIAIKGASLTLTDRGAPFDCDNFATTGSGGIFGCGLAITIEPVGDTADVIRFSEKP